MLIIKVRHTEPDSIHNRNIIKEVIVINGRFPGVAFVRVIPFRVYAIGNSRTDRVSIIPYQRIIESGLYAACLILLVASTLPIGRK